MYQLVTFIKVNKENRQQYSKQVRSVGQLKDSSYERHLFIVFATTVHVFTKRSGMCSITCHDILHVEMTQNQVNTKSLVLLSKRLKLRDALQDNHLKMYQGHSIYQREVKKNVSNLKEIC